MDRDYLSTKKRIKHSLNVRVRDLFIAGSANVFLAADFYSTFKHVLQKFMLCT